MKEFHVVAKRRLRNGHEPSYHRPQKDSLRRTTAPLYVVQRESWVKAAILDNNEQQSEGGTHTHTHHNKSLDKETESQK